MIARFGRTDVSRTDRGIAGRSPLLPRFRQSVVAPVVLAVALLVTVVALSSTSTHAATFIPSRSGGTWEAVSQLAPGVTYTYALEHGVVRGRERDRDWNWIPGRGTPPVRTSGELNIARVGHRDEIRFWFDIEGVRVNGTAANDIQAVAGAVLLASLTGPEPLSADAVRLLATAFEWTQWYDLFASSTFRNGLVWQVSQHPPHRFTAVPRSGLRAYWGELTRGRDVVMEIGIELHEPLPLEIVAYSGRDYYKAELVRHPVPGPRR